MQYCICLLLWRICTLRKKNGKSQMGNVNFFVCVVRAKGYRCHASFSFSFSCIFWHIVFSDGRAVLPRGRRTKAAGSIPTNRSTPLTLISWWAASGRQHFCTASMTVYIIWSFGSLILRCLCEHVHIWALELSLELASWLPFIGYQLSTLSSRSNALSPQLFGGLHHSVRVCVCVCACLCIVVREALCPPPLSPILNVLSSDHALCFVLSTNK